MLLLLAATVHAQLKGDPHFCLVLSFQQGPPFDWYRQEFRKPINIFSDQFIHINKL